MSAHSKRDDFFEVFPWNPNFETGIEKIDEQHRRLVELINTLAVYFASQATNLKLDEILNELADYAIYHFSAEEEIWHQAFDGDIWLTQHQKSHKGFEEQLIKLKREEEEKPLEEVLDDILAFLINWLAFHILDSDMRMAKVIQFMNEQGLPLSEAKRESDIAMSGTMQKLIGAVLSMYGNLSTRTLELMKERTSRQRVEKELAASQRREKKISDALMNAIPGILYLYDKDLRLIRWNANFAAVSGYSSRELEGKSALDFVPAQQQQYFGETVDHVAQNGYHEFEVNLLAKNGTSIPYKLTGVMTSIKGKQFYVGVGIDITKEKEAERHLVASRNMLENAQRIAHLGHWTLYHDTGKVFWSDEVYRILDLHPELCEPSLEAFLNQVHEKDRRAVEKAFKEAVKNGEPYSGVHRLHTANGDIKYVKQKGSTEYSPAGEPIKSVGTLHDITQFVLTQREAARLAEEAKEALMGTITAVAKALEARDSYTSGHQERVARIAVRISVRLALTPEQIEGIHLGARIHDLGKIGVPAELLSKPTRLNDMEYGLIKSHPETGAEILDNVKFPWPIREIISQHHERLDGSGYPKGLRGDEICLEARIVAVADVYEAMSAHRPYRASLGMDKAVEELTLHRGTIYDADAVDALIAMIDEDPTPFMP